MHKGGYGLVYELTLRCRKLLSTLNKIMCINILERVPFPFFDPVKLCYRLTVFLIIF